MVYEICFALQGPIRTVAMSTIPQMVWCPDAGRANIQCAHRGVHLLRHA